MKVELYEKVVEVRRVSDRVMADVFVFEEVVLRLICGYAPKSCARKKSFYDALNGERDMYSAGDSYVLG